MVDIETLSSEPNAVILQIGAVKFDPFGEGVTDKFLVNVNPHEYQYNRHIDTKTIKWWQGQGGAPMDGDTPLWTALAKLREFCHGADECWAHGSSFDHTVLAHACKDTDEELFSHYRTWRDTRTLFAYCNGFQWPENENKHDALADAVAQAVAVQRAIASGMKRGE